MSKVRSMWDQPVRIRVTGRGQFPWDMLRHDCAWPATTTSAMEMGVGTEQRTVTLICQKRRFFTPERWASFGWSAKEST